MFNVPLSFLLFAAVSIGSQTAPVRAGCSQDDALVAVLPPGRAVDLRFAVNDGSACYKIAGTVDGMRVDGYVHRELLEGLSEFERGIRNAPEGSSVRVPPAEPTAKPPVRVDDFRPNAATEQLYGLRVLLRYEKQAIRPELARNLVSILDQAVIRVSGELGCSQDERLVAILQSRPNYLKSTDAAEWSAGLYDGRIHVAMPDAPEGESELRRVLTHETVHACLAALSRAWPAWLQEGIAQKLSGDTMPAPMRVRVRQLALSHTLPRLENLAQSWSRMSAQHARLAYTLALSAADLLWEQYAAYGIRNVLRDPARLPQITADLDRRLGL